MTETMTETMITTIQPDIQRIRTAQSSVAFFRHHSIGVLKGAGADRIDLLNRLTTNDLTGLRSGDGKQTVVVTEKARIIDVVTVLQNTNDALLLTAPHKTNEVRSWLHKYVIMDDARYSDVSGDYACVELMGPQAPDLVTQLTGFNPSSLTKTQWHEINDVRIVRMPSSCEVSYWLLGSVEAISALASTLIDASVDELDAADYEHLRIVSGIGAIGNEFTEAYNPLEAGLLHLTSFTKGCYIGQEVIARLDSYNKVKQRVMGLVSQQPLEQGMNIIADSSTIGSVTSSSTTLDNNTFVALGYVRGEHAIENTTLQVGNENPINVTLKLFPIELW